MKNSNKSVGFRLFSSSKQGIFKSRKYFSKFKKAILEAFFPFFGQVEILAGRDEVKRRSNRSVVVQGRVRSGAEQ